MHHNRHQLIGMGGCNPLQPIAHPRLQGCGSFSTRYFAPLLIFDGSFENRIALSRFEPVKSTIPLPKVDFTQIWFDLGGQFQMRGKWRCGLMGAL